MKNKWKSGFLLLLGVNLLIIISLFIMLIMPVNQKEIKHTELKGDHVAFEVKSNKEDLNKLINQYMEKEIADSPINYQVQLRDEVELHGTLPFFSQQLNLKLTFEPEALDNGDLVLKQKSISIGSMDLPVSYVLNFIRDNYKLPKGVDIRPNDKLVYVNMQQLKIKSDVKIQANEFDLKKNNISFTLLVPTE
ncbi:MAG: hypothetical protein K0Q87_369 [Neobacillus sp.]|jgi:uncharacterized protein YpmS|nr:hypothetical protein [Neobacillus sp.]